jgi:hypothetical protein
MQKEVLEGVPYWKDKSNNLFSFELDKKNLIQLGCLEDGKVKLKSNWTELYQPKLNQYREDLTKRERSKQK